jgi:hypothetical protein
MRGPGSRPIGIWPSKASRVRISISSPGATSTSGAMPLVPAGVSHKLDDERSLWTVVVIGVLEPSRGPAERIIGPQGRPEMRWLQRFSARIPARRA